MITSEVTPVDCVEALQVGLKSVCAPDAFGQAGSADPLVYATLRFPDGSYFYASEVFGDASVAYGFLVTEHGDSGWDVIKIGAELSANVRFWPHTPPKALRELLRECHDIALVAPRFL